MTIPAIAQFIWFEVEPTKQTSLAAAIVAETERCVRHRPGLVSSTFHASHDGRHVLNHAQWRTDRVFARNPGGRPRRDPKAEHYRVAYSVAAPDDGSRGP